MQEQQQRREAFQELKAHVNLAIGICQIVSKPLEVWWRKAGTAGDRYYGVQAFFGWLFIPFYGGLFFPTHDQRPLLCFWALTTALLFWSRIKGLWLRRRGYECHSRYVGTSKLARLCGDRQAKAWWESFVSIVLGMLIVGLSMPLGCFLMLTGLALGFSMGWNEQAEKAQIRAMRDARIEAGYYMEQMQEE